jgi:hypothetical protein
MRFKARMAAMMSRAFPFSLLAMETSVGDDVCSKEEAGGSEGLAALVGAGVVVAAGCGVSFGSGNAGGAGGSGSREAGFSGRESKSVGCRRDAFIRAAKDGG